ncbi:M23 family metallopeptidase [Gallaecimonas sp. GXIMD4217]|uniref:M23 family metallopeptidase n=1 Tax=Gallaecimonas sp. GXIMD4217 TaxID=3131927 RepID=UPI00311B29E8
MKFPLLVASLLLSAAAQAQIPLQLGGDILQGSLVRGQTAPGATVTLDGQALKVSPQGHFVFGFGRDDDKSHQLVIQHQGEQRSETLKPRARKYAIQKVNGVPAKTVNPPKETLARIRREGAKVAKARALDSDRLDFTAPFQWPLTGPVTGVYGSQRYYNGEPRRPHFGVDVAAPTGTLVYAPAPGKVVLAEPDLFYSGGTLIIDHGYGVSSSFLHLSGLEVKVGQEIKTGDPIARVGATGRATGPHLDWRINWFKERLDPALLVPPMPKQAKAAK